MKKIVLLGMLIVFLLLAFSGVYVTIVGMASSSLPAKVRYTCTDNDNFAANSINTRGTVSVISTTGERIHYTDYCLNEYWVREYYCDLQTNQTSYFDFFCHEIEQKCNFGRCLKP